MTGCFFIEVKLFETLRCRLEYGSFMFGLKRLTFFLLRLIFSDAQHFMLKGNVFAVFVIRWTSSFVQRLQFPLVLVKIFASFFCYKASGVSFMFGIKRLLTCLFRISSVLCLCWVRTRYRRGRMPSWLGLEQVAVSVRLISLYQFSQCWDMFLLQVFYSEERLILIFTFLCFNCFYRCSSDTSGLLVWAFEGGFYFWI